MNINNFIKTKTQLPELGILNTIKLLNEGATIPFISRYRKEFTGGLDEVQVLAIRDALKLASDISSRQNTIIKAIDDQGKLTSELKKQIFEACDLTILEDLYLPFKLKRLTRGEKARKAGLEPLAILVLTQSGSDPSLLSMPFINSEITSVESALSGAKDIIAEIVSEHVECRSRLRRLFHREAVLKTKVIKGKLEEGEKYKDYFDFSEALYKIPSHRFLAIYRGEKEGVISLKAQPEKEDALNMVSSFFVKSSNKSGKLVEEACQDAYKRLLSVSLESELLSHAKAKADVDAIRVFATNLKQLLLAAPLGSKRILALDPGFRSGCKLVCLDQQGNLLTNTTIFPHPPQNERDKAASKVSQLVQMYKIDAIAIGDGTAGRETEAFIRKVRFDRDLEVYVVREDGASIYSVSPIARKEFPDYDVTVRGAVSIGRRLIDPLSELVKIDPKSMGVGQYQHEVNQLLLKECLDDVVVSAVNLVGVDLNTASPYLLQYVSGLGPALAENIVKYRADNGDFKRREELKKVKLLGPKAFEQSAGFLRIKNGDSPLDNSAIHPESYGLIESFAKKLKVNLIDLIGDIPLIDTLKNSDFSAIDSFTFEDLCSELKKPGRDPRKKAKVFEFDTHLKTIDQIREGMKLPGIVTNVTDFGAFVNIGIKENGLIHKSQLSDTFVTDASLFISLHEHVLVEVVSIDVERKRIGLKKV